MTAFIKYCGGCNESYSRSAAAKLIKSIFAEKLDFTGHDIRRPCDIGIIISGCDTECVKEADLAPARLYVRINSMASAEAAIRDINAFIANSKD